MNPVLAICQPIRFWTSAKLNTNSEMRTQDQTQAHFSHSRAHGNAIHTSWVPFWHSWAALWVMSWGMWRVRAWPELLRCSFVYTDGFQMRAGDWSSAEHWGAAQQFRGNLDRGSSIVNTWKTNQGSFNDSAIVSKGWESFVGGFCISFGLSSLTPASLATSSDVMGN